MENKTFRDERKTTCFRLHSALWPDSSKFRNPHFVSMWASRENIRKYWNGWLAKDKFVAEREIGWLEVGLN